MLQTVTILILTFVLFCPYNVTATLRIPDTGQTKCYLVVEPYGEILCEDSGQDGAYQINPMSFTDNSDGTVTDNNTGLTWQKCSIGQNGNASCSGSAVKYNWFKASGTPDTNLNPLSEDVCGSLNTGGNPGWRLPTKRELASLIDYSIQYPGPAINQSGFPNTINDYYWSSNTYAFNPNKAWYILFSNGLVASNQKEYEFFVRCVRGGNGAASLVDNGDGSVSDCRTGLTWQQSEPGEMTWPDALSYCEGLVLNGLSDWRLPNIRELESITDYNLYHPASNKLFFPQIESSNYWSSTSIALWAGNAWIMDFDYGSMISDVKTSENSVRCVRGGQNGSILPVWISTTPNYFESLQNAHDSATDGDILFAIAIDLSEDLSINKSLSLRGGFNSSYSSNVGFTRLKGTITITGGSLTVENLQIQ